MSIEIKANSMLSEMSLQRTFLGDRAALLAGENALLKEENENLKKRISELEEKNETSSS